MANISQQNWHELQNLLPDLEQNDARLLNDTRNKVTLGDDNEDDEIFTENSSIEENKETDADELKRWADPTADPEQQENAIYDTSGRVPNGTVPHKGAEGTKAHGNEIHEIFTEDVSPHENGEIEKVETEKVCYNGTADDAPENIANSTKIVAAGSTSNPDQREIGNYVAPDGGVSNDKVSNNRTADGNVEPNNEIDEILTDGSIQRDGRIGYGGNTRSQKPVRLISFDLSDNKHEDSDSDAEPHSYQDTKNTNEAFWPSPRPDNRNLGCFSKLRCCSRSDRLRETFNQLCLHIHNHYDKEMEYILDEEEEKNQAKLLVMEDDEGLSCLMKAITRQSFGCLKLLLKRFINTRPSFANYNIKPLGGLEAKNETNLFHVAAEFVNQKEIIDYLLEHCPSKEEIVNKEDRNGVTPLLVACQTRNVITINRLVEERDVKIDHIDKHGNSPINYVAKSGCAEILTLFLKRGHYDVDNETLFTKKKLYGGKGTILQALIESRSPDTLWECFKNEREQELIRKCLSIELENDSCFLHKVCCKPLVAIVDMAVSENSYLLEELDNEGMTPLMRATEGEQVEIVNAILANENGRNTISIRRKGNGRNALMIACEKDFDEIAQRIMMQGSVVKLDAVDEAGENVLHIAARKAKVLKAILHVCSTNDKYKNYKETLQAKDNKGYASLHYAGFFGLPENVNLLLEHGVPYGIANLRSGRLVIHEASWLYGNLQTVKALVSYVEKNYGVEAKKEFINAGDCVSQTSLHIAASCGKHKTVEYLLENGAIMKSDCEREIPLHLAAACGCPKTLGHLLQYFPNFVNHENRVGETPAMFAAVDGRTETLQLLLKFKARLQVDSNSVKNQRTCLEWAVINKMSNTASIILNHNDWKADMERASVGADGLLAEMVKHMPQLATEVLAKCVTEIGDQEEKKFDFFALQTVKGEQSNSNDPKNGEKEKQVTSMQALEAMIDNSSDQCLRHIVVQEFLNEKWTKRIRRWYITALVLYAAFLISLTTYIGLVKSGASNDLRVVLTRWICGVCACFGVVIELMKFLCRKTTYEFSLFVAYLSVSLMYICVFIFLPYSKKSECPWQAGAIAIFLAWINFIWFLKRIPAIGIYMIMVKKIFVTFLKVLIPVMFFIMAFAMTFFTLDDAEDFKRIANETKGFESIPHSLLTTFAMMAGDINYHEGEGFLQKISGTRQGLIITIFWVIAVIVLSILISNLLTALAVGDTSEILRRSIGEKRVQRAKFVVNLEKFLSKLPFMDANFVKPLSKSPKSKQSWLKRLRRKLKEMVCPNFVIADSDEEKSPETGCHECSSVLEQLAGLKASLEVIQRNQEYPLIPKKRKQRMPRECPRRNSMALLKTQGSYLGTCSI